MSTYGNGDGQSPAFTLGEIEAALKRLAGKPAKLRSIYQAVGDTLLHLRCVAEAVDPDDGDRDAKAKRFLEVLTAVIKKVNRDDYRFLLQVTYALEPQSRNLTAAGRLSFLSKNLYPDDDKPLKPDTIRRTHQAKAIGLLAKLLHQHEAAYIAENGHGLNPGAVVHLPGQEVSVSGRYVACDEHGRPLNREVTLQAGEAYPEVVTRDGEFGWLAR